VIEMDCGTVASPRIAATIATASRARRFRLLLRNTASRAHPARSRRKLPATPADPRMPPTGTPCSRR
jgi:hypothetical protein